MMTPALRRAYRGAAGIVAMFGAAQLAVWASGAGPATFPLPSAVLSSAAALARNGTFLASVGDTMAAWAQALAITVVIAVAVGLLLGSLPWVESALLPVIEFLRPFPAVVLIPLVLLIVQDDGRTQLVIIVYASVWPVLINTVYGVRNVDPLAKGTLPSAAPFIATGVRIAASFAFVVAIAIEVVGTGNLLPSLGRLLAGWVVAALAGIVFGVAIGRSPLLADLAEPLVHFGRAVPPPTLVPVFLFVFKIGTSMEVASIIFGAIWPVLPSASRSRSGCSASSCRAPRRRSWPACG